MKQPAVLSLIVAILALPTTVLADHHEAPESAVAEFILPATEREEKKLKRKAQRHIDKAKKDGSYLGHRIVHINADALTRRDPMPVRKAESDIDATHEFTLGLSVFDGKVFKMHNTENYILDIKPKPEVWDGEVLSADGGVVGEYKLTTMFDTWALSYIAFTENDKPKELYTFYPLEGRNTVVLIHKAMPEEGD